MSFFTLPCVKRSSDRQSRTTLRQGGQVPAVVYGHGFTSESIAVSGTALEQFLSRVHASPIVELVGVSEHPIPAVVQDVQRDVLRGKALHVDFQRLRMEERLTTKVSVTVVGESPAVKEKSAVLVKVISELDVECLPQDLVSSITVDITGLANVHDRVRVRDIVPPSGVRILNHADDIVVTVQEPRCEEATSEKPVENVEAVEVVGTKKEEKEEKEGTKKEEGGKKQ